MAGLLGLASLFWGMALGRTQTCSSQVLSNHLTIYSIRTSQYGHSSKPHARLPEPLGKGKSFPLKLVLHPQRDVLDIRRSLGGCRANCCLNIMVNNISG